MPDTFSNAVAGLESPAEHAFAITKHDTNLLTSNTRALYVGGAGDVTVDMVGGETSVLFSAVPAGTVLPIRATRVKSMGTTATSVVGLY